MSVPAASSVLNGRSWIARRSADVRSQASSENRIMPPIPFRHLTMPRDTYLIYHRGAVSSRPTRRRRASMDGLAIADLQGVVARINFTQPMAEKPYSYNYEPPPGVPPR